ncbi:MAG: hypothetical protein KGM99_14945 [Burkholderiales bacterium]|nr:hypothetical protein [Burkholderiales bacterium]
MTLPFSPVTTLTSLSDTACEQAAAELLARRRQNRCGSRLPASCRPQDFDSAWRIQQLVSAQLGDAIAGWKCAMPAADKYVLAPIYASTIFREATVCQVHPLSGKARIEPELAYVLGTDLPSRSLPYRDADIDGAVGETRLALELIASRYDVPDASDAASFYEHLADGLFNQGLVLGATLPVGSTDAAAMTITINSEGEERVLPGLHPAGNPRAPLHWLAEFLRQRGIGLSAGQVIITGSYAGSPDVALGQAVNVHFDGMGQIRTCFQSR